MRRIPPFFTVLELVPLGVGPCVVPPPFEQAPASTAMVIPTAATLQPRTVPPFDRPHRIRPHHPVTPRRESLSVPGRSFGGPLRPVQQVELIRFRDHEVHD